MSERAMVITDNGDARGFYLQELIHTAQQITDAGAVKRIFFLARRLLGKQPEQPRETTTQRMIDLESMMRFVVGLNDANVRRVTVVARTLAQMEQEAGQQATDRPKTPYEGACAMLAKLPAEDQARAYDMIESMFIDWLEAQPDECAAEADERKAGDDVTGTLKALINDELERVTKPKTLEAIQAYARIARQREGRE